MFVHIRWCVLACLLPTCRSSPATPVFEAKPSACAEPPLQEPVDVELLEEDTKASNEARAVGAAITEDPRNFDLKAGLLASAKSRANKKKAWEGQVQELEAAVAAEEGYARLDFSTPSDGHCLFHALAGGGLLDGIPESLTVEEFRDLAVSSATLEQLQNAALTSGPGGTPISVEAYVSGMRTGLYGDNMVIAVLARELGRSITVITVTRKTTTKKKKKTTTKTTKKTTTMRKKKRTTKRKKKRTKKTRTKRKKKRTKKTRQTTTKKTTNKTTS